MKWIEEYLRQNGFNYRYITVDDLVFSPFTRFKCMLCANYYSTYACPPFTPTWKQTREILSRYERIMLVWKYFPLKKYIDNLVSKGYEYSPRVLLMAQTTCDYLAQGITKHLFKIRDWLESRGFECLVYVAGGGCRKCKRTRCNLWGELEVRDMGDKLEIVHIPKPCRFPREREYALEGVGISVYDTLRKLGIEFEEVPRTRTVAVGLIAWRIKQNKTIQLTNWLKY